MADKSYIPYDIVESILLRLSVELLLMYRTVCKLWNAIISDPAFVQSHLHRTTKFSPNLFLSKLSLNFYDGSKLAEDKYRLFKFEDRKFRAVNELPSPYYGWKEVLCSCNGVLLLSDSSYRIYVLWNPSTRAETKLWFPYNFYGHHVNYGLCHDPTDDDFKVVVVSTSNYVVYSCKNKSWSKKKQFPFMDRVIDNSGGVYADGAFYWVVWRHETVVNEIVYFDPRDDDLKMLQKPKHVGETKQIYLVNLRGRLCLYCNGSSKTIVQIWVKKEGLLSDGDSWKEMMTIENVKTSIPWFRPLCFFGNKIVIRLNVSEVVLYCPLENKFEEVGAAEFLLTDFELVPYLDSMFFPIQKKRPTRKRKCAESI